MKVLQIRKHTSSSKNQLNKKCEGRYGRPLFCGDIMIIQVISMVLPLLVLILLGMMCHAKGTISKGGLEGIRAVVGQIALPVVLFNAFFTATYNLRTLLVFVITFVFFGIALAIGCVLKKLVKPYDKYMPLLVTSSEVGMLGYALFSLIAADGTSSVAIIDIGQTVFAYTVWFSFLKMADGKSTSAREVVSNFVHNRPAMGMLLGIILGVVGVGELVQNSSIYPIVASVISNITAPTSALILIIVGYDMKFRRDIIKPALVTTLLRVVIMGLSCVCVAAITFAITGFDRMLLLAFMLVYSLPAPFIIPLFADMTEDEGAYVATTYSMQTIATVVLYVGIVVWGYWG